VKLIRVDSDGGRFVQAATANALADSGQLVRTETKAPASVGTYRCFFSSFNPTNRECLRCLSGVHSTNSNWPTRTGRSHRQFLIFATVRPSPHRPAHAPADSRTDTRPSAVDKLPPMEISSRPLPLKTAPLQYAPENEADRRILVLPHLEVPSIAHSGTLRPQIQQEA
jgi:hypothetical protein